MAGQQTRAVARKPDNHPPVTPRQQTATWTSAPSKFKSYVRRWPHCCSSQGPPRPGQQWLGAIRHTRLAAAARAASTRFLPELAPSLRTTLRRARRDEGHALPPPHAGPRWPRHQVVASVAHLWAPRAASAPKQGLAVRRQLQLRRASGIALVPLCLPTPPTAGVSRT